MKALELTDLAIDWLKTAYPGAIIVKEMSVSDWGGALLDVAAITSTEVIGVEIKGEGDSPSRLELQGLKYGQVARKMWLLADHESTLGARCLNKKPKGWGVLSASGGRVWPEPFIQSLSGNMLGFSEPWESTSLNPWAMCGTLWRDELYDICRLNGVQVVNRPRVNDLQDAIIGHFPVPKLHELMVDQLRRRVWKKPVIDTRTRADRQAEMGMTAKDQRGLFDG